MDTSGTGSGPLVVRSAGEHGLLVDTGSPDRVGRLLGWLHDQEPRGRLDEVVPAVTTVLLIGSPDVLSWFAAALATVRVDGDGTAAGEPAGRTVELTVVYDGEDLTAVADRTGLSVAEVVTRHRDAVHVVGHLGFSPGQPFLTGVPPELRLPRRSSPRTRVPPGSLAIATEFTTVYPRASPGGWHLLGRYVGPPLWDAAADPPNRLAPGDRVVFREVGRA